MSASDRHAYRPRMVFVTQSGGHNPNYVQWLIQGWLEAEAAPPLCVVVAPEFPRAHPEIADYVAMHGSPSVRLVPLADDDWRATHYEMHHAGRVASRIPWLHQRLRLRYQRYREWRLSQEYAARLGCGHCLYINFDFYQSLAAGRCAGTCRFSGIYHNLFFHYPDLFRQSLSAKERVRGTGQRLQVRGVLRNRSLHTLFVNDPFLAQHLAEENPGANIVPLPTPAKGTAPTRDRIEELRSTLAVDDGRKVFLLQGGISPRAGVPQVLQAVQMLDHETAARSLYRVCRPPCHRHV